MQSCYVYSMWLLLLTLCCWHFFILMHVAVGHFMIVGFHYMITPKLIFHSTDDGHFCYFHISHYYQQYCQEHSCVCFLEHVCKCCPGSRKDGSQCVLMVHLLGNTKHFPTGQTNLQFYQVWWEFPLIHILSNSWYGQALYVCQSGRCEMVSQYLLLTICPT